MRRRLDTELVRRGLTVSEEEARVSIAAGLVTIDGGPATKASTLVADSEAVAVSRSPHRFVSRGGDKLGAALHRFGVDPTGRDCLDAGASTGGFTDCLLARGASRVAAVDVGYGQLDWRLRRDDRVTVIERTNVRDLEPGLLPFRPQLLTADLSFISLRLAVPGLVAVSATQADFLMLVKPQFEAARDEVEPGGVVRDARTWQRAIEAVVGACEAEGLSTRGVMASPITGPAGNVEFFLHSATGHGLALQPDVDAAIDEALALGASA